MMVFLQVRLEVVHINDGHALGWVGLRPRAGTAGPTERAKRTVVMAGVFVQQGTHDELMAVDGLYRRFVVERKQAAGWKV